MDKKLSNLSNRMLPRFVQEKHPQFVVFVVRFLEYLERESGEYDVVKNLINVGDIDLVSDQFFEYHRQTFLNDFPIEMESKFKFLIKQIKTFYNSKGTEKSFEFLFKTIFNTQVEIYYPKDDILRASDGKWYQPTFLMVGNVLSPSTTNFSYLDYDGNKVSNIDIFSLVDQRIRGVTSGAEAYVDQRKQLNLSYPDEIPNYKFDTNDEDWTANGASTQTVADNKLLLQSNGENGTQLSIDVNLSIVTDYELLINAKDITSGASLEVKHIETGTTEVFTESYINNFGLLKFVFESVVGSNTLEINIIDVDGSVELFMTRLRFLGGEYLKNVVSVNNTNGDFIAGEFLEVIDSDIPNFQIVKPRFDLQDGSEDGIIKTNGSWLNNDGFLSDKKYLIDSDYYQDFSYEIISDIEPDLYMQIVKDLVHPAGFKLFGKLLVDNISFVSLQDLASFSLWYISWTRENLRFVSDNRELFNYFEYEFHSNSIDVYNRSDFNQFTDNKENYEWTGTPHTILDNQDFHQLDAMESEQQKLIFVDGKKIAKDQYTVLGKKLQFKNTPLDNNGLVSNRNIIEFDGSSTRIDCNSITLPEYFKIKMRFKVSNIGGNYKTLLGFSDSRLSINNNGKLIFENANGTTLTTQSIIENEYTDIYFINNLEGVSLRINDLEFNNSDLQIPTNLVLEYIGFNSSSIGADDYFLGNVFNLDLHSYNLNDLTEIENQDLLPYDFINFYSFGNSTINRNFKGLFFDGTNETTTWMKKEFRLDHFKSDKNYSNKIYKLSFESDTAFELKINEKEFVNNTEIDVKTIAISSGLNEIILPIGTEKHTRLKFINTDSTYQMNINNFSITEQKSNSVLNLKLDEGNATVIDSSSTGNTGILVENGTFINYSSFSKGIEVIHLDSIQQFPNTIICSYQNQKTFEFKDTRQPSTDIMVFVNGLYRKDYNNIIGGITFNNGLQSCDIVEIQHLTNFYNKDFLSRIEVTGSSTLGNSELIEHKQDVVYGQGGNLSDFFVTVDGKKLISLYNLRLDEDDQYIKILNEYNSPDYSLPVDYNIVSLKSQIKDNFEYFSNDGINDIFLLDKISEFLFEPSFIVENFPVTTLIDNNDIWNQNSKLNLQNNSWTFSLNVNFLSSGVNGGIAFNNSSIGYADYSFNESINLNDDIIIKVIGKFLDSSGYFGISDSSTNFNTDSSTVDNNKRVDGNYLNEVILFETRLKVTDVNQIIKLYGQGFVINQIEAYKVL